MKDDRLNGVAQRLGLHPIPCPDCHKGLRPDGKRCNSCGATGRLWSGVGVGAQPLPDAALRRLA